MIRTALHRIATFLTVAAALAGAAATAAPDTSKCLEAVARFKQLGNVSELMADAYGYAVLPTIGKGAFGIGGAGGAGCAFVRGQETGKVTMGQITIGFQLGGQAYSQLVLIKHRDVYDEFTRGNFQFGADATAVALNYGASATANTQGTSATFGDTKGTGAWKRGMAIFTLAKGGLMYEASIGGQRYDFEPLQTANRAEPSTGPRYASQTDNQPRAQTPTGNEVEQRPAVDGVEQGIPYAASDQ